MIGSTNSLSDVPAPEQATSRPRAVWRLLAVCAGAALVAGLSYVVTVGTRTGQLVSELILGGRPASSDVVVAADRVLDSLSRSTLIAGAIALVTIAVLQRRPRLAVAAVLVVIGANVSTQLLKAVVLDRSDLLDGMFYVLPNSFPSGHATAAASIAVGLLLVLPPLLRAPTVLASAIVVAIVGASTLIAGWHRMADAIGGVFVATAWGAGLAAVLAWRRGFDVLGRRTTEFGRVSAALPIWLGAAVLVLGVLAYLIIAADPLEVLLVLAERGGSPALFWVGILVTIGTSMLALGALGFALRDIRLDPRNRPSARLAPEPIAPPSPDAEVVQDP